MLKKISVSFLLLAVLTVSKAQVSSNINSGSPNFPFPQFLDYGLDRKTLASHNAPGVTHAEMEQRIRDAYQMVCNNVTLTGDVVDGVDYGRPNPPTPCDCIEADGYYLLAAAYMGDRDNFNRIYMWAHDRAFQGVQRFIDGQYNNPGYEYSKGLSGAGKKGSPTGTLGGATGGGQNSATDGDVDMGLALLLAYKQWGDNSGVTLSKLGNKNLSYKEEAIQYIKAMVDTVPFLASSRLDDFVMGDIGLDGYVKGGDTWKELTTKASSGINGIFPAQGFEGQTAQHIDYYAPAWFKQFRFFLQDQNESKWSINQYKRGEASSDFLMGSLYAKSNLTIPVAGWVNDSLGGFQFTNFLDGEDFRTGWRTVMNYVWHGDATYTWDPDNITVKDGVPNSYEKQIGQRFATFLKNQQGTPWGNPCIDYGTIPLTFKGVSTIPYYTTPEGKPGTTFNLNFIQGTGAPSAIADQDFELMGQMFRQCVIKWQGNDAGQQYLGSKPYYFHEWFKMLGLLVLSGNYHAPDKMNPSANLKIYHKVDKTYGFTNDLIKYTISFRNYGSMDASGTVIKFGVPLGFSIYNAGGGTLVGDSIQWNIQNGANGTTGFKTGGLGKTIDSVIVILKAGPTASGRYCTNARISCSNGSGWISNEYPNNQTAVMERNCVDITKRALKITKTANKTAVQYGQNVTYKIKFENLSEAGWLNGGRPEVNVALAHRTFQGDPKASQEIYLQARIFNDADEAYIDYGNYRFSYFINEPSISCLNGAPGCTGGWNVTNSPNEGGAPSFMQENIVAGSDTGGKWNQRVVFRFGSQLATTTQHLVNQRGNTTEIHEGSLAPMRTVFQLGIGGAAFDWTDDWSWNANASGDDGGLYFPVGDDYTNPDSLGKKVTSWHTSACEAAPLIQNKILVEEWDGYTWRRILGKGPLPGRDLESVIIKDTLPAGFVVKTFLRDTPLATKTSVPGPNGTIIYTWTIPKLLINQRDSIIYQVQINGTCPSSDLDIVNKAWISSPTESPLSSAVNILASCLPQKSCPEPTTMTKVSDKVSYTKGDAITYTIKYTQTIGSIYDSALTQSNNWTAKIGNKTDVVFSNGTIAIPQLGSGDLVLTNDYSYGLNTLGDGILGTIKLQEDQNTAITVRNGGGSVANGVYIVIKPSFSTIVNVFNGTSLLGTVSLSIADRSSLDFKIVLTGNRLDFWMATSPATFSSIPVLSVTGILQQTGYAGIARGNTFGFVSGTSTLLSWETHLDAAFNVRIVDSIPKGVVNAVAINAVTFSNSRAFEWTLVSGKTPLPFNSENSLSWKGTYDTCAKITNIAYVNTLGIGGNQYGVCYDINCATFPVCTAPTSILVNDTILSVGGTTQLIAKASPANANYIYNWYKLAGNVPMLIVSSKIATLPVSDTGRYIVRVADGDTLSVSCYKVSAVAKVTYQCVPPASVSVHDTTLLKGGTTTLTAKVSPANPAYIYNWYRLSTQNIPIYLSSASGVNKTKLTVSDTGRYVLRVSSLDTSNVSCYKFSFPAVVSFGCAALTSVILKDTVLAAGGTTSITAQVSPSNSGLLYDWYKLPNLTTVIQGSGLDAKTLVVTDTGRYVVKVLNASDATCFKTSNISTVTYLCEKPVIQAFVNGKLLVAPYQVKFCEGQSVKLSFAPQKYNFEYDIRGTEGVLLNGIPVRAGDSASVVLTNAASSAQPYYLNVYSDPGNLNKKYCWVKGDSLLTPLIVTSSPQPVAIITTSLLSYCSNVKGLDLTAQTVQGASYQWYKDTTKVGTNTPNPVLAKADSGTYSVKVSNGNCIAVSTSVKVAFIPQPLAKINTVASKLTYCIGTSGILVAKDAGSGASYLWKQLNTNFQATTSVPTLSPAVKGVWQVIVTKGGCSDTSSSDSVKEVSAIASKIVIQADPQMACIGTIVKVNITEKTEGTVQWIQDGVSQGTTDNVYSFTFAQNTRIIAKLSTAESCADPKEASDTVDIARNTQSASIMIVPDQTLPICEGLPILFKVKAISGVVTPSYQWFVEDQLKGTDSTFNSNKLKNGQIVKVTTTDACSPTVAIQDTFLIKLKPAVKPSVTLKSISSPVCQGETVTFKVDSMQNAGIPPSYTWFVNFTQQTTGTLDTFATQINGPSAVFVQLTSTAECANPLLANSDTILLDIQESIKPLVNISSSHPGLCPVDNAIKFYISATVGAGEKPTFVWYVNDQPASNGTDSTFYPPALVPTDKVYVIMTSSLSCRTQDTARSSAIFYTLPSPLEVKIDQNVAGQYPGICQGDQPTFTAISLPEATYTWYINENLQPGQNSSTFLPPILNNNDQIKVVATLPNCLSATSAQDETSISVDTKPQQGFENAGTIISLCGGNDTILMAKETNKSYAYKWLYNGDSIAANRISPPLYLDGNYTLVIKNGACTVENPITIADGGISVHIEPKVTSFSPGDQVKLVATGGNAPYVWSPTNLITTTTSVAIFYPTETTRIYVAVSNSQGCKAMDSAQVIKLDKLFIPNAITPETGDQNAFWNIKGAENYLELDVRVYNRWGSLVHEQRGYSAPWDGTLNGKALPTGTYYYVIKDKALGKPRVGDLTIVR